MCYDAAGTFGCEAAEGEGPGVLGGVGGIAFGAKCAGTAATSRKRL